MNPTADKIIRLTAFISMTFLMWAFLSYIDIIAHNTSTYNYASWNMLEVIIKNIV